MEEDEFSLEFNFISSLALSSFSSLSVFSSHPLFSCFVTLCTLILLYLPHLFWRLVLSPVLILTGILLLAILRFGASQRSQDEQSESSPSQENRAIEAEEEKQKQSLAGEKDDDSLEKVHQWITTTTDSETEFKSQMGIGSDTLFEECFVESWNVRAPLEVIYEEYEGEEEAEVGPNEINEDTPQGVVDDPISRSLSRYYPESESDSYSSSEGEFPAMGGWDSPENVCFRWDEEDREGLIEIALDGEKKRGLEFQFEEENLIEIDISPSRHNEFSGEPELFSGGISGD